MYIAERFDNFKDLKTLQLIFNGDVVFKGYPVNSRKGNFVASNIYNDTRLAITTSSKSVDGAWAFIRTFLAEEWQRRNVRIGFPTNKNAFEARLISSMGTGIQHMVGNEILDPLSQKDADQIMSLIDSLSVINNTEVELLNIVMEGVNNFINGFADIDETIRIIQSRASIYVSERS
jgi:ABC-type glycerol-3-phosphate transport system substrate-binding protein